MHLLISKKIVVYFLMFCFLVSINNISFMNVSFPKISKIEISGLNFDERKKIENIIFDTYSKNIFHLDKEYLKKKLIQLILLNNLKYLKNIHQP